MKNKSTLTIGILTVVTLILFAVAIVISQRLNNTLNDGGISEQPSQAGSGTGGSCKSTCSCDAGPTLNCGDEGTPCYRQNCGNGMWILTTVRDTATACADCGWGEEPPQDSECNFGSTCPPCEWPKVAACGCGSAAGPGKCGCMQNTDTCGNLTCGDDGPQCDPDPCPEGWVQCSPGSSADCVEKTRCETECTECHNPYFVRRFCKPGAPPTPIPTVVERPLLCDNAKISGTTLTAGNCLTVTSTAKKNNVTKFSLAFYNLENLYGPGNPKPYQPTGTQFTKQVEVAPTNSTTFQVCFDEVNRADQHPDSNKQIPHQFQINAYFIDPDTSKFSAADGNCVVRFNTPGVPTPKCGDDICHTGEACDTTKQCTGGGTLSSGECRADCTYCGDGVPQTGEECDDGNNIDSDACNNSCKLNSTPSQCGNGICNTGESCDKTVVCPAGTPMPTGAVCRANCTYCGDRVRQYGEECDDGNQINGDGCSNQCLTEACINCVTNPICGNGRIEVGEECEPNSYFGCGPGAQCTLACVCIPKLPGLCGSSCVSNIECPTGNSCYNGRCRLDICVPGFWNTPSGTFSSPYSGANIPSSNACSPNGCELLQCLSTCAAGNVCPAPYQCDTRRGNICVLPCCVGNAKCDALIANGDCLCPTALIGKEIDMIILALVMVLVGVLIYRTDLTDRLWFNFKGVGGEKIMSLFNASIRDRLYKKKISTKRNEYESKFKKEK